MRSSQSDNLWPHELTTTSLRRRETPHSVENYPRNTPAKLSGSRASETRNATRIQKAIHAPHARATQWQLCQPLASDNFTAQLKRLHHRAKSRSSRTSRTSTGGPCLGARGKQAQLAQANGSKFNLLLMLVAQMSTYPRVIATHYCSWGSRNFKLTHGALTAFEDLGVVAVAVPRRARRCFSARLRRPPTRHRNCGRLLLQNLRSFDQSGI